jgi:hypothetical protein
MPRRYKEDKWGNHISPVRKYVKKGSVRREPSLRNNLSAETEESPLLESVTRERLVKT